jgi:hypothetical protein
MSGRPTSCSIRTAKTYHGIAYGARALWRRRCRSSRRSNDLPRRPGKPDRRAKLRRLTRRWITLSKSRGSEGEASGLPALPGRESARGQQHGGKAWSVEKASKALPRKARVIRRKPHCLKPSHQRWNTHTLRHDVLGRSRRYRTSPTFLVSNLPAGGRRTASSLKETEGPPTSRSIRPAQGEYGMAYGARALRPRSTRSSRRSHDLPGRPGKPGRRAKGHR